MLQTDTPSHSNNVPKSKTTNDVGVDGEAVAVPNIEDMDPLDYSPERLGRIQFSVKYDFQVRTDHNVNIVCVLYMRVCVCVCCICVCACVCVCMCCGCGCVNVFVCPPRALFISCFTFHSYKFSHPVFTFIQEMALTILVFFHVPTP